jgi:uncharacterized protein (DUF3084 family)
MEPMTINRDEVPTVAEQVSSLENGYADLLLENKALGESIQLLTRQVHELEDQQAITRQAYQNLLAEKDETIKAKDDIITRLDKALAQAKECNDRLDHRLELLGRRTAPTATSVRIEGDGLSHPYETSSAGKVTFGEVQLAKRIYHNIHYPAIRALLGYETCRILDIVLDLDQPGVSD